MEEVVLEFDEVTKDCVHAVLDHFWITRDQDTDTYLRIRDREEILKHYFEEHFRLRLHVNKNLVKLEKIPVVPEVWMGIPEFRERRDYSFFCCLLAVLESKQPDEQFLLGSLCDEIVVYMSELQSEALVWRDINERRSFARALKVAESLQIVRVEEGNVLEFATDPNQPALLTVTGNSQYFLRRTSQDLRNYSHFQALLTEDGRPNEYDRLFRHLFFSPVVHWPEMSNGEKFWLLNNRMVIAETIRRTTHMELETYKEAVLVSSNERRGEIFPNAQGRSMVVLHFATMLYERVTEFGEGMPDSEGCIRVSQTRFSEWLNEARIQYGSGWSKKYQDMELSSLLRAVLQYLQEWKLAKVNEGVICLFAPLVRMLGQYPVDFQSKKNEVI